MIAITLDDGTLLRGGLQADGELLGFHRLFGFVSEAAATHRLARRRTGGLPSQRAEWLCKFRLEPVTAGGWRLGQVEGAKVEQVTAGVWKLVTDFGAFLISETSHLDVGRLAIGDDEVPGFARPAIALALLLLLLAWFIPAPQKREVEAPVFEPVLVKMAPEVQKPVAVMANPLTQTVDKIAKQNVAGRRAVEQNLGFLKMLGRKDLTKALGGIPTKLLDASPGAGAGGKAGSGGELLVGLGEGVKRTTVGNSGVAGLGGVGKSGAGGGGGGYGTSLVGSGEGRALSSLSVGVPLSRDVVLEGGLDRSVIQATIAKYLNQVRACYEEGLKRNAGLTGVVQMNFDISGSGDVLSTKVGKTTLGDTAVEGCIGQKMMSWKFPKPLGGVAVKVGYPFLLRPVNS